MDLTLPTTITDIGDNAFDGNSSLERVYIPNSNASVGTDAFPNDYVLAGVTACFKFDSTDSNQINDYYDNENNDSNNPACSRDVEIPQGVTAIGDDAFKNKSLTSVIIPDSMISIRGSAFKNNSLTSLTIPDSVTTIEEEVFNNNSLTSVTIGSGISLIGYWAFKDNNNLSSICIEREAAGLTLGVVPFPPSATVDYQSDGDCYN